MDRVEWHKTGNRTVAVHFVGKDRLAPYTGTAYGHTTFKVCYAEVREDLPRRHKAFVLQHELYHLRDRWNWWGMLGREIRANFIATLYEPIGALTSAYYALVYYNILGVYLGQLRPHRTPSKRCS